MIQTEIDLTHHITELMKCLGMNLDNDIFRNTPRNIARSLIYDFTAPNASQGSYTWHGSDMLTILNCEHTTRCVCHLERVFMQSSLAYIPDGRALHKGDFQGSCDVMSTGAHTIEYITHSLADITMHNPTPKGCMVITQAMHSCSSKPRLSIVSAVRGAFVTEPTLREEFLTLWSKSR